MLPMLYCRMDIAMAYGTDAAIFLDNIVYWTLKNQAEKRHYHDGRYWMYASFKGLSELYPLWSPSQIKRIIKKLREGGALLVGDYNDDRELRTNWYSPSDKILAMYDAGIDADTIGRIRQMAGTNSSNGLSEIVQCNNEQGYIQGNIPPLPPTGGKARARRKRHEPREAPDWKPERFAAFWEFYRTHCKNNAKQDAMDAWDKLKPSDELIAQMGKVLVRQLETDQWKRGIGIPYAATWLNKAMWEEDPGDVPKPVPQSEPEKEEFGWQ